MAQNKLNKAKLVATRLLAVLVVQTVITIITLVLICAKDVYIQHSPVRQRLLDLVALESAILLTLVYGLCVQNEVLCFRKRKLK